MIDTEAPSRAAAPGQQRPRTSRSRPRIGPFGCGHADRRMRGSRPRLQNCSRAYANVAAPSLRSGVTGAGSATSRAHAVRPVPAPYGRRPRHAPERLIWLAQ